MPCRHTDHGLKARQRAAARQDAGKNARLIHNGEGCHRTAGRDQLSHLRADSLPRQPLDSVLEGNGGLEPRRIEAATPISGMEAKEAQDAEIVLFDSLGGIADEADAPGKSIDNATDRIMQGAVGIGIDGVHREVASPGIAGPIASKSDDGVPAVGFDVGPERRHLERSSGRDDRHGTMCDPGRHRLETGSRCPGGDHVGPCRRRNVDIVDRHADQGIANRSAHDAGSIAVHLDRGDHTLEGGIIQKRRTGDRDGKAHRKTSS